MPGRQLATGSSYTAEATAAAAATWPHADEPAQQLLRLLKLLRVINTSGATIVLVELPVCMISMMQTV
jgi:hypothetical protein